MAGNIFLYHLQKFPASTSQFSLGSPFLRNLEIREIKVQLNLKEIVIREICDIKIYFLSHLDLFSAKID